MTALQMFQKGVNTLKNYVTESTPFSVDVDVTSYPIKISFFEESRQITIEDDSEDNGGQDSSLQFVFFDKMQIKTREDFHVSEEVFNKLKNLSKEVNRLYLLAFFENFNSIKKNIADVIHDTAGIDRIDEGSVGWDGYAHFWAKVRPQRIIEDLVKSIAPEVEVER